MTQARELLLSFAAGLCTALLVVWLVGLPVGMAYWIWQGSFDDVVLSVMVPTYGLLSTLAHARG